MWSEFFKEEESKKYYQDLMITLHKSYKDKIIFPPRELIFNCFKLTDINNLKVVLIGQDPYHNDEQANGLSFSVNKGIKIPRSLKNIFIEINKSLFIEINNYGDLSNWGKQGVLLLNRYLTVEKNKPLSHIKIGWEEFTNNVIKYINQNKEGVVFLLLGNDAKKLKKYIDENKHHIVEGVHPSPLSANRGFFGSNVFKKVNSLLKDKIDFSK